MAHKKKSSALSMDDFRPSVHLDSKDLPAIKKWKVGGEYNIVLKVRQTSMNEHEDSDKKKTLSASFDILNAASADKDDFTRGFDKRNYS